MEMNRLFILLSDELCVMNITYKRCQFTMNNIEWHNISHLVNTAICYNQNWVKSLQLEDLFHLRFFLFLFLTTAMKIHVPMHYTLQIQHFILLSSFLYTEVLVFWTPWTKLSELPVFVLVTSSFPQSH